MSIHAWCLQVKTLPKSLHETDAYKGLLAQAKQFQSACPLVGSLKRSKLSHRHWEELLSSSNTDRSRFPVHDVENSLRLEVNTTATLDSLLDLVHAGATHALAMSQNSACLFAVGLCLLSTCLGALHVSTMT